ncbi:MAG: dephospho-CoA kinase [Opitutus sp.]|nr:dephospho-CoA kinase [Opitutus sp.]
MIAGITGGMGCGKSTVARLLERRGFRRLDSDQLVREWALTAPAVIAALRVRHGNQIVGADGGVDRGALAGRVFADDAERVWLEDLVHPLVYAAWREALAAAPTAWWVIEVPLLFEKSLENWFDFTVCVTCAPEQQLARLEQRGLPRGLAGQRISKQLPLARKFELSDFVLWNEGSPEFLEAEVDRLAVLLSAV